MSAAEELPPLVWRSKSHSQDLFLQMNHVTEVLAEGNRYGGKSDALMMSFAQHCEQGWGPAWRGILFRRTHKQLKDIIDRTIYWFDPIFAGRATYNSNDSFWRWDTGETLLFRYMDTERDFGEYKGAQFTWIGWEELTLWPNMNCYKAMMSCLRSTHVNDQGQKIWLQCRATTNPGDVGHGAVKEYFKLPQSRGRVRRIRSIDPETKQESITTRCAIMFDYRENQKVMQTDPEYVRTKILPNARNEAEKKAWAYGDWDIPAGGLFDEAWYKSSRHVIIPTFAPADVPESWRMFRSYDHGESAPFSVGWWAQSDGTDLDVNARWTGGANVRLKMPTVKGDLFRFREWYGWNGQPNEGLSMLYKDISFGIIRREVIWRIWDRVRPGPADSSIFDVYNGNSVAKEMEKNVEVDGTLYHGARFVAANKKSGSRVIGWNKMRELFIGAIQDGMRKREHPGMFVCDCCDQFRRIIPMLPRDKDNPNDADTNSEDHCLAGDTLVDTDVGPIPIRELTNQTRKVMTIYGWKSYNNCRLTRRMAGTVRVKFDDGTSVECTPDHRFLCSVDDRALWIEAKELLGKYVIRCRKKIQLSLAKRSRNSEESGTTDVDFISSAEGFGCIALSGSSTMEESLRRITSIIKTAIETITRLITCRCSGDLSTARYTAGIDPFLNPFLPMDETQRASGTDLPRVSLGINSITRKISGMSSARRSGRPVEPAVSRSWGTKIPYSAVKVARQDGAEIPGSMISGEPVSFVKSSSSLTGILRPGVALGRVVAVEDSPDQDVYCMAVPGVHHFCVNGGLVVHNCADETRYVALASGPTVSTVARTN